jgi:hypothetical protein
MTIIYHKELIQRTPEWYAARCGLITASEMKLLVTEKTLKTAANDKSRAHVFELVGQRITQFVEPSYESFDMQRGKEDELDAKILYNQHYAPVEDCGFVTNDEWGFKLGYSPDGLIGEDGLIEAKSRNQKYQTETICDYLPAGKIPEEFMLQIQTGLMITRRKWCDFISYSNGMPMVVIRVLPDLEVQRAIEEGARATEKDIAAKIEKFNNAVQSSKLIKTVRKNRTEEIHT